MQSSTFGGSAGNHPPRPATPAAHEAIQPASAPPVFLNLARAAALLGVSERTFHDMRVKGLVPEPYSFGERALRWSRDELVQFVRDRAPRAVRQPMPAQLAKARGLTVEKAEA